MAQVTPASSCRLSSRSRSAPPHPPDSPFWGAALLCLDLCAESLGGPLRRGSRARQVDAGKLPEGEEGAKHRAQIALDAETVKQKNNFAALSTAAETSASCLRLPDEEALSVLFKRGEARNRLVSFLPCARCSASLLAVQERKRGADR